MSEDKYFKNDVVFNEQFGHALDFAIETILKNKIKKIDFCHDCQYLTYTGKVKTYLSKRKNRNHKSLIIKSDNFEIECLTEYWDEIKIKKDGIDIQEVGLFFTFEESIWKDYQTSIKKSWRDGDEDEQDICECGHKQWEEHKSSFYEYKGLKMVAQECNVKGCKCKKFKEQKND